jgi:hypothetical protein
MDLRRLRSGELLAGVSSAGLLLDMFLGWFSGRSAWEAMPIVRVVLVALVVCGLTVVVLTVTSRTVAMACSAAAITVGIGALALLFVVYRVVIDEPGSNATVSVQTGAYLGLALVVGVVAGAWRTLADERTGTPGSLRQTERVLAVRGAPRKPPPARDPGRPSPRG